MSNTEKNNPSASLIVIGNEILSGRTKDVHVNYLSLQLKNIGVILNEVRIIPDNKIAIVKAVRELKDNYNYLFTTGGIGPTHDDITIESVAQALNKKVIVHKDAYSLLKKYYASQGVEFTKSRKRMTRSPEGASMINNPVSAAPGFNIENIYIIAGVPLIAQAMINNIIPTLNKGQIIYSKTLRANLPEGILADAMKLSEELFNVSIGSYPSYHRKLHGVSIVAKSNNPDALSQAVEYLKQQILEHSGEVIIIDGEV